ncbi:MAG: membrane protein insertion efficiency factor YidD [Alphaproteobacteria bacterium]|nr:membrane protein insertion efficiency factor YidD [Alphaproteobacteria bacterium]
MSIIAKIFIKIIRFYQKWISPITINSCRFTPTCSSYALEAIVKYGALKGGWISFKRIVRCNPWGGYGYDPVPDLNGQNGKKDKEETVKSDESLKENKE